MRTLRGVPADQLPPRAHTDAVGYRDVEWTMLCEFLRITNSHGYPIPEFDHWWTTIREDAELSNALDRGGPWPINRIIPQLGFAQHNGVPTRLLDWSVSPYFASWFAVSGAVQALARHLKNDEGLFYSSPDDARFCVWAIQAGNGSVLKSGDLSLEVIMPSYHLNSRVNAQKGAFTLLRAEPKGGILSESELLDHDKFIKTIESSDRPLLVQIVAPHKIAPAVLDALSQHGVTRATMYPGVEYIAPAEEDKYFANLIKDMHWLRKPEKTYVPAGAKRIFFFITEKLWKDVAECQMAKDGHLAGTVIRLLKRGLQAELADSTPETRSKRREKEAAAGMVRMRKLQQRVAKKFAAENTVTDVTPPAKAQAGETAAKVAPARKKAIQKSAPKSTKRQTKPGPKNGSA